MKSSVIVCFGMGLLASATLENEDLNLPLEAMKLDEELYHSVLTSDYSKSVELAMDQHLTNFDFIQVRRDIQVRPVVEWSPEDLIPDAAGERHEAVGDDGAGDYDDQAVNDGGDDDNAQTEADGGDNDNDQTVATGDDNQSNELMTEGASSEGGTYFYDSAIPVSRADVLKMDRLLGESSIGIYILGQPFSVGHSSPGQRAFAHMLAALLSGSDLSRSHEYIDHLREECKEGWWNLEFFLVVPMEPDTETAELLGALGELINSVHGEGKLRGNGVYMYTRTGLGFEEDAEFGFALALLPAYREAQNEDPELFPGSERTDERIDGQLILGYRKEDVSDDFYLSGSSDDGEHGEEAGEEAGDEAGEENDAT